MKQELKGKLEFISLWEPIKLFTDSGEVDLKNSLFEIFEKLNGKKSRMDQNMNSIGITADENAFGEIEYINENGGLKIVIGNQNSMSNVGYYLPDMLRRLNARKIIVSLTETSFKIQADPEEKVFGLYYTNDNNCKIPDGQEKTVCQIGTRECCIFVTLGSNGFECAKFSGSMAGILLDRHSKKQMNASRIGNCAILGRDESKA